MVYYFFTNIAGPYTSWVVGDCELIHMHGKAINQYFMRWDRGIFNGSPGFSVEMMLEKYQWIPHDTTGFWMTKWPQMEITACAKNWQTRWFYRINMLALARCPDEIGSEGFFHHWTIPKPIGIERSWHWALIADAETRFSIQWF